MGTDEKCAQRILAEASKGNWSSIIGARTAQHTWAVHNSGLNDNFEVALFRMPLEGAHSFPQLSQK